MKIYHTVLFALVALACSCTSPLDINTPRDRTVDTVSAALKPTRIVLTMNDGTSDQPYLWESGLSGEVDTTGGTVHLTLRGRCEATTGDDGSLPVREIALALTRVPCDGVSVDIVGGADETSGAEIAGRLGAAFTLEKFKANGGTVTVAVAINNVPGARRLVGTISILFPLMGRPFGTTALLAIDY